MPLFVEPVISYREGLTGDIIFDIAVVETLTFLGKNKGVNQKTRLTKEQLVSHYRAFGYLIFKHQVYGMY